ncbi:MAG TPA: cyclopropane-fatty-acyl-phospholipid synthase family protein [Acetobacteraceae bacterium]|nr:cyclopropane-fatty-acyl-phospholipid synthase family protein [Acetobacteraceae bacterium]
MQSLLDLFLKQLIKRGRLTVRWPNGSSTEYGDSGYADSPGGADRAAPAIAIETWRTVRRITLNPGLAVGEAYMDGSLKPLDCTIYDVLDVLTGNLGMFGERHNPVLYLRHTAGTLVRRLRQMNTAPRARRNVAHHYDLNGRLYSLFLDRDRQYSCAYFPRGDETLDEAQAAKKRHIAAKLRLDRPGLTVLDVGCGWGGMALTLARDFGARVTGITLSTEQLAEARARAEAEGLSDRVRFELQDYRAMTGQFDRIVSVGMFEHVGVGHFGAFFAMMGRCLKQDGVALLHAIGRSDGPGTTNAWLAKYIFPGGYSPALSETLAAVEKSGLVATDIEVLRLHYAETLRHWRRRFAANRDAIAALYDERFCRMFEFYLAGSELAFRHQGHMVAQIQLTHDQAAVPLIRDYMVDAERATARAREAVR